MERLVRTFRAAGDPTRLRILRMLAIKPMCVCEVMTVLGMAQSTVSKHLRVLADAMLVRAEHEGMWTIYGLTRPAPRSPEALVLELVRGAEVNDQYRNDAAMAKRVDRMRVCRRGAAKGIRRGKGG